MRPRPATPDESANRARSYVLVVLVEVIVVAALWLFGRHFGSE
jgi:hypothetical protein